LRGDKNLQKNKNKEGKGIGGDSSEKNALTSKESESPRLFTKKYLKVLNICLE